MFPHHNRHSIRLKGYDYAQPGAYFITLVAYQHDEIFGVIPAGAGGVELSPLGQIVHEEWLRSAQIRSEIRLFENEFIIMPDHMHAIVHILEKPLPPPVGPDGVGPNIVPKTGARGAPQQGTMRPHSPPRSLGSLIAGYKSSVSSRAARELHITGIWQRNYYEHIIRTEAEFRLVRDYIQTNPLHWKADQLGPFPPGLDW